MICTKCSTPIRPVVAVDIDGTIGNYHDHFTKFASEYVGRDLPRAYTGGQEFSDYLQLEKRVYRDIKLAYRQGGLKRSMPIIQGAPEFMTWLREQDVEIWIATTRPYLRLDNIDPDTREWLTRNRIPWDYMIYGDDKYEQLVSTVDPKRIMLALDDQKDQLKITVQLKIPSIQIGYRWNMDDVFFRRFDGGISSMTIRETVLMRMLAMKESE